MGTLPRRKDIPPWVRAPDDLKDPEVFQVQTRLLEAVFGVGGSRIPYIEQVSKVMLELKVLESSGLTEIVVYGSYLYKLRAKWMLQSMAERHRQRQERGTTGVALSNAVSVLETLDQDYEERPLGAGLIRKDLRPEPRSSPPCNTPPSFLEDIGMGSAAPPSEKSQESPAQTTRLGNPRNEP